MFAAYSIFGVLVFVALTSAAFFVGYCFRPIKTEMILNRVLTFFFGR